MHLILSPTPLCSSLTETLAEVSSMQRCVQCKMWNVESLVLPCTYKRHAISNICPAPSDPLTLHALLRVTAYINLTVPHVRLATHHRSKILQKPLCDDQSRCSAVPASLMSHWSSIPTSVSISRPTVSLSEGNCVRLVLTPPPQLSRTWASWRPFVNDQPQR